MANPQHAIEFKEGDAFCTILCSGLFSERRFAELVEMVKKHRAAAAPGIKYLVDLRATDYLLDNFARFRIAENAALQLRSLRIAVLGNSGVVDKITENTGFSRGLMILVTDNEAEAMRWVEK